MCMMEDVLVSGRTQEENNGILQKVFERLQKTASTKANAGFQSLR